MNKPQSKLEMESDLFNKQYWDDLRKRTSIKDTVGRGLCDTWSDQALDLLDEKRELFQKRRAIKGFGLVGAGLSFHTWLESKVGEKRYIVDGTAGQINPRYSTGFYGFLDEAPPNLSEVYSNHE